MSIGSIAVLVLLTGCAAGSGFPGALALVLLLTCLSACAPLIDENHLEGFFLRRFLLQTVATDNDSSSNTTALACSGTQDYTQSFDLSAVDPATAGIGFTITGENSGDRFGGSVSARGDFNGDGINDILIGAGTYNGSTGRVYLIFGRSGSGGDIDTSSMTTSFEDVVELGNRFGFLRTIHAILLHYDRTGGAHATGSHFALPLTDKAKSPTMGKEEPEAQRPRAIASLTRGTLR